MFADTCTANSSQGFGGGGGEPPPRGGDDPTKRKLELVDVPDEDAADNATDEEMVTWEQPQWLAWARQLTTRHI